MEKEQQDRYSFIFLACDLKDKTLRGYAGRRRVTFPSVLLATEACKRRKYFFSLHSVVPLIFYLDSEQRKFLHYI